MKISQQDLGGGITEVVLANQHGTQVTLWSLGATLAQLVTADQQGQMANIVLSVPLETALAERCYLGATIGRVAGRISQAQVRFEDTLLRLTKNEGQHHLHGGPQGFDQKNWQLYKQGETLNEVFIEFIYKSPAFENGYPGNLTAKVRYTLTSANKLSVEYKGETDEATLFNPTNHSYFNLAGRAEATIENHYLEIPSEVYIPLNSANLPLGVKEAVEGTPFNLKKPQLLSEVLNSDHKQIKASGGLNHGFELTQRGNDIKLYHPRSGRKLTMTTSEAASVIYTGNHFNGELLNLIGSPILKHGGVAIETQNLPDCDNQVNFGSVRLLPCHPYFSKTTFAFGLISPAETVQLFK